MSKQPSAEKQPSQEHLLLEFALRLGKFRTDRRAVHIHLSRLQPHNRREHHLRVAINTFESLVKSFEGQIFVLSNADIMFVCKGASIKVIDEAVMRLRYLFSEDPLALQALEGDDRFSTWFDFERHYDGFVAAARALQEEEAQRSKRLAAITGTEEIAPVQYPPIDPHRLGELVDSIHRADLSNMMRRQSICALVGKAPPQPIFRELYISIADLRDNIMPGFDLASDRWLFQHLTQTLDRRMLKLLAKNDDSEITSAFSVNLNVATLTSKEFIAFDAGLRSSARGTIVIEVQLIDILADLRGFHFARDFVKERGYRICLDGITELTLSFADRERIGFDLVKLAWRPGMLDRADATAAQLAEGIKRIGQARTILCHCDNANAVELGQGAGVNLFQGRYIDKLTAAARQPTVTAPRPRAAIR